MTMMLIRGCYAALGIIRKGKGGSRRETLVSLFGVRGVRSTVSREGDLLWIDIGIPRHLLPLLDLRLDRGGVFFGAAGERLGAGCDEGPGVLGIADRGDE